MGRVKSLSNSGSFVLRKDNQNAKGEYQVYIQYSVIYLPSYQPCNFIGYETDYNSNRNNPFSCQSTVWLDTSIL